LKKCIMGRKALGVTIRGSNEYILVVLTVG